LPDPSPSPITTAPRPASAPLALCAGGEGIGVPGVARLLPPGAFNAAVAARRAEITAAVAAGTMTADVAAAVVAGLDQLTAARAGLAAHMSTLGFPPPWSPLQ
jgi:hypothetical protein